MKQTVHFFEHYKDLSRANGSRSWAGATVEEAKQEIVNGLAAAAN